MRRGELLNLTWTQIDLDRREITLIVTKNGKPRVIPLTHEAIAVLTSLPRYPASPQVFHNPFTGRPIQYVKTAFSNTLRRARIENFRFHDIRHTFASWAVQSGMDLFRLSRILGHSTTEMTQRYAHLATRDLHKAIREMETNIATNDPEHAPSKSARIIEWPQSWAARPEKT
jgi:integrase